MRDCNVSINASITIALQVFHLLGNFLPHILLTQWHMSFSVSGVIASFVSFSPCVLSPFIGHVVDRIGLRLEACLAAGMCTCLAYYLLIFTPVNPFIPVFLLSLALSFIPTITLALVPLCIPSDAYGIAYGSMEVMDSIGIMIGNFIFGLMYKMAKSYMPGLITLGILSLVGVILLLGLMHMQSTSGILARSSAFVSARRYETIPLLTSPPPIPLEMSPLPPVVSPPKSPFSPIYSFGDSNCS